MLKMEKNNKYYRELLRKYVIENNLTRKQASENLGIAQSTLSRYLSEKMIIPKMLCVLLEQLNK